MPELSRVLADRCDVLDSLAAAMYLELHPRSRDASEWDDDADPGTLRRKYRPIGGEDSWSLSINETWSYRRLHGTDVYDHGAWCVTSESRIQRADGGIQIGYDPIRHADQPWHFHPVEDYQARQNVVRVDFDAIIELAYAFWDGDDVTPAVVRSVVDRDDDSFWANIDDREGMRR